MDQQLEAIEKKQELNDETYNSKSPSNSTSACIELKKSGQQIVRV